MNESFQDIEIIAKPILKWAGGKTQLLKEIIPRMPIGYNNYIEPFLGGGALFFALSPVHARISDSNPELINLYNEIVKDVESIISDLKGFKNNKEDFYRIRSYDWDSLPKHLAAARTIFLNKTCFNGLFRVNKKGKFNVPYGNNKRANFCDENALRKAAIILSRVTISCVDYHQALMSFAQPGDFIFLDPPYIPINKCADFKRYTKEQFSIQDQIQLADDVNTLHERGCYVMLTNSNHPLVYKLYGNYKIESFQTRRSISKDATNRTGEDVIVTTY